MVTKIIFNSFAYSIQPTSLPMSRESHNVLKTNLQLFANLNLRGWQDCSRDGNLCHTGVLAAKRMARQHALFSGSAAKTYLAQNNNTAS